MIAIVTLFTYHEVDACASSGALSPGTPYLHTPSPRPQVLHHSLTELYSEHAHYDKQISFLSNYTLNNGGLISELAMARISDGISIISLLNSTATLEQRLYHFYDTIKRVRLIFSNQFGFSIV